MFKVLSKSCKSARAQRASEKGQGLVEYALIMVLVAVACIVILALLGPAISDAYCNVITALGGGCTGSARTFADAQAFRDACDAAGGTWDGWAPSVQPPTGYTGEDCRSAGSGNYDVVVFTGFWPS